MMQTPIQKIDAKLLALMEDSLSYEITTTWERNTAKLNSNGWYTLPNYTVNYLVRGQIRLELCRGEDAVESFLWQSGDVLFVPPSLRRRKMIESKGNVHFMGMAISFYILQRIDVFAFFDMPLFYRGPAAREIASLLGSLNTPPAGTSVFLESVVLRKARCLSILGLLVAGGTMKPTAATMLAGLERVSPALDYLDENISGNVDFDQMAKRCSLSKSRFRAVFRDVLGCAPGEYLIRQRLKKAASMLLLENKTPVSAVALACGWNDPFHFSRIFKVFFHLSPKNYRNMTPSLLS